MRIGRSGFLGAVAGVVLGGIVATAGCEGADDEGSSEQQAELRGGFRFHHGHRGRDAGSVDGGAAGATGVGPGAVTGAAADAGAATDCDVCTRAQECRQAVAPGNDVCMFSAASCASMVGDARPAYVNACLTFLVSARGAQQPNPPAECR